MINNNRLISSSGDSNIILWNIEQAKSIQKINTLKYVNEESIDKYRGIIKFDYNPNSHRLIVQLFGLVI